MTAIKTHQAEPFLKALDSRYQALLFYGSDAGLVAERARAAAKRLASMTEPPGEILRIEDADLEAEPDRLLTEIQTLPMFGGPKIVLTRASRRVTAQLLKPLIEAGTLAATLLVEAGNLRAEDALRKLFEKPATAAAIACYTDEGRDLDGLIRDTLGHAGKTISREAQQTLASRLGADRALTRGELDKLVLYTHERQQIDVDDIDAVIGDAAELAIDKVVHAAASGEISRALTEFDRLMASGESPQSVIAAIQWNFQRLHRIRSSLEAGRAMDDALRQLRPPVHFKSRPQLEAQCRVWTAEALLAALSHIARTTRMTRSNTPLEAILAERLILDLARQGAARAGTRSGA